MAEIIRQFSKIRVQALTSMNHTTPITDQEKLRILDDIKELGRKIIKIRISNRQQAYQYAQELYRLAESIDYAQGMAEAKVMFSSQAYFVENNTMLTLQYLEEAEEVLHDKESYSLPWLYSIKGSIYWRMGDLDTGYELMHKSIVIARDYQDDMGIGWTSYLLGGLYIEMKQYEAAEKYHLDALEILRAKNDIEGTASSLSGLGNIAVARKEYDKAFQYYQEALPIVKERNLHSVEARILNDMGVAYEQQQDYTKALAYLFESYHIRTANNNALGMITTELNLGRIYTYLQDYTNAILYYEKAEANCKLILAKPRLQRAYQGLAEVYKKLDKPKEALAYYEQYMEIYTIVMGEENEAKHASLEIRHNLEKTKQEAEIHKLKNIELKKLNDLIAEQNKYIIEETIKSERLLHNILPEEVAAELKEKGYATPQFYDQATILFTDFKGFTNLVEQVTPQAIIEDLNTCFLAFDEICEEHNLEKIKTIGDSYMAVAGIPTKNKTNAIDAVRAGLAMQNFMQKWKADKEAKGLPAWELRLGIHTGCLVAGVIGKNKFAYDVWGDSVNIASRMESSGEVGKVNISESTYQLVCDKFQCTPRGKVVAKNKGEIEMYFVEDTL